MEAPLPDAHSKNILGRQSKGVFLVHTATHNLLPMDWQCQKLAEQLMQECGHRMCAHCTLALCCHNKPDPIIASPSVPSCPFCMSNIVKLNAVNGQTIYNKDYDLNSFTKPQKSWRSWNSSEGSSSFKDLSTIGSFGKIGRGSGRIVVENAFLDKRLGLDA